MLLGIIRNNTAQPKGKQSRCGNPFVGAPNEMTCRVHARMVHRPVIVFSKRGICAHGTDENRSEVKVKARERERKRVRKFGSMVLCFAVRPLATSVNLQRIHHHQPTTIDGAALPAPTHGHRHARCAVQCSSKVRALWPLWPHCR